MVLYVLQGVCGALQCLVHAEGSVWSTAVFCMCCRECGGTTVSCMCRLGKTELHELRGVQLKKNDFPPNL